MLCFMTMTAFLSMGISNIASSVLCTSVLLPVIRDLPRKSRYVKAMVLGLAFAANIGGMLSPISSPQNAISLSEYNSVFPSEQLGFGSWIGVTGFFCGAYIYGVAHVSLLFHFAVSRSSWDGSSWM
jgi:phosphate transporter